MHDTITRHHTIFHHRHCLADWCVEQVLSNFCVPKLFDKQINYSTMSFWT